ncbi:MAG: hypothetical protein ACRDZX_14915, partial [Acidimicrobiales bacterium]
VPGGAGLVPDLAQESRSVGNAARGYAGGLADLQATGCYSAPANDMFYAGARAASAAEGPLQRQLSAAWESALAGRPLPGAASY